MIKTRIKKSQNLNNNGHYLNNNGQSEKLKMVIESESENNNKLLFPLSKGSENKDLNNQPINKPSIFDLFKIKQTRIKTPFYNKISDSSENNIDENNNDIKIIKGIDNFKLIYQDKEEILNADSFIISSLNVYGIPQSVKYPIIELLMFKEGYINDESELLNKENINSLIGLLNNIANTLKFYDKTYYKMIIENINMLYKIIRTKLYEYKDLDNLYKAFNQYDGFIDELFKQNLISCQFNQIEDKQQTEDKQDLSNHKYLNLI